MREPGGSTSPDLPGLGSFVETPLQPRRFGYDEVYRLLRRALITRRIAPGTRLVESELATQLDVSRTPIRDALRRLESDGFVTRARGGGLEASQISAEEIRDLFLVRGELDRLAARLAAERAKPDDWEPIQAQVARLQQVGAGSGVGSEAFNDLHLSVHASIYAIAFGPRFAGLLTAHVLQYLEAAAEFSYAAPSVTLPAGEQHQRLIAALSSGDANVAMAAADEHVRRSASDADHASRGLS